jgi:transposase InsO family protein
MRVHGISGVGPAKIKQTTLRGERPVAAPGLVHRDFSAQRPAELWLEDFTYIRTWEGWAYLAVVLDVYTRRIFGWQLASHMRQGRVRDAFRVALPARQGHDG